MAIHNFARPKTASRKHNNTVKKAALLAVLLGHF